MYWQLGHVVEDLGLGRWWLVDMEVEEEKRVMEVCVVRRAPMRRFNVL